MPQGDASQYPILPISLSIMTICFLVSLLISLLADYLYDFYLVRFSKTPQKNLIEDRVKSDIKRLKQFLQSPKLEKFDKEAAKNRLTIISKLTMEKINSKESRPFLDAIKEKEKSKTINPEKKNEEIKKEESKPVEPKKKEEIKKEISKSTEQKLKEEIKKEKTPVVEIKPSSPKPQKPEASNKAKNDPIVLTRELTVDEAIKKLSNAPRTATVVIEIKEAQSNIDLAPKSKVIKFTPGMDEKARKSDSLIRFSSDDDYQELSHKKEIQDTSFINTINANAKPTISRLSTTQVEIEDKKPKIEAKIQNNQNQNNKAKNVSQKSDSDMLEMMAKKTTLNQNLSKTYRDNQSKVIQERLKLDAEFKKTRSSPDRKKNKNYKYDDDDEEDNEETKVTKIEFE